MTALEIILVVLLHLNAILFMLSAFFGRINGWALFGMAWCGGWLIYYGQ